MRKRRNAAPANQAALQDQVRQVTAEYREFLAALPGETATEDAKAFAARHAAARAALAHLAELLALTAKDGETTTHPDCLACEALRAARQALSDSTQEDADAEPGSPTG